MAQKMLIDATHAEETRVVVVDGTKVEEFDFETAAKRQLAGNIYLAKVTRVEPSLQAAFVDYGGNRHGFLAFSEIHPDYYQIPVADRRALLEEERQLARAAEDDAERPRRRRPAPAAQAADAGETAAARTADDIPGMAVIDAEEEAALQREEPTEERPYAAVDHAADSDDSIESVADEDVSDEIRAPRRPRLRKYKIQEVIKVRQILLVQVVKEERGNKGAALTTYLSLAGRYCVLMPNTARGGGISRKITQPADRKKLKEIAASIEVPEGAGLIIRTAGAKRTKAEIKRDCEYLMRLWDQIRELTLKSIAPAPIYEEGNLIKRSIRDLYSRDIDEVLVEGAEGYRTAKDFMKMIMPSHAKNVRLYADPMPLFARYQVESYLGSMFNPTVQLKSGGYIVIGVTEALVAIDVNSGRATKEGSIEETAVKTNLEAAEEIARQLRLRDLAGLIVIDFIDMEERKNNAAVEKKLKDKLKNDRARIQVGRISGFGLLEMSRQRLRPGILESTTQPCPHCHGTGILRSDDSLALQVLRQIEEEGTRGRSREVLLRAPVGIVNFLMNQKRDHIALIEGRYGMAVRLEADPRLISPDFTLERFKTATRQVTVVPQPVVSLESSAMEEIEEDLVEVDEIDEDEEDSTDSRDGARGQGEPAAAGAAGEDNGGRKRRRRRRRRKGGAGENGSEASGPAETDNAAEPRALTTSGAAVGDVVPIGADSAPEPAAELAAATEEAESASQDASAGAVGAPDAEETKPKRSRSRSRRRKPSDTAETAADGVSEAGSEVSTAGVTEPGDTATSAEAGAAEAGAAEAGADIGTEAEAEAPKPRRTRRRAPAKKAVEAPAEPGSAKLDTETPGTPPVEAQPLAEPVAAETTAKSAGAETEPGADTVEVAPAIAANGQLATAEAEGEPDETLGTAEAPIAAETADAAPDASRPRRRGWWSARG